MYLEILVLFLFKWLAFSILKVVEGIFVRIREAVASLHILTVSLLPDWPYSTSAVLTDPWPHHTDLQLSCGLSNLHRTFGELNKLLHVMDGKFTRWTPGKQLSVTGPHQQQSCRALSFGSFDCDAHMRIFYIHSYCIYRNIAVMAGMEMHRCSCFQGISRGSVLCSGKSCVPDNCRQQGLAASAAVRSLDREAVQSLVFHPKHLHLCRDPLLITEPSLAHLSAS